MGCIVREAYDECISKYIFPLVFKKKSIEYLSGIKIKPAYMLKGGVSYPCNQATGRLECASLPPLMTLSLL